MKLYHNLVKLIEVKLAEQAIEQARLKVPIPGPLTYEEIRTRQFVTWDCGCEISRDGLRSRACEDHRRKQGGAA